MPALFTLFFPDNDIRLVAVSDGVDSAKGENEFTPFRNIMNEWYARDISRKCRTVHRLKGESGIPLGKPPYGYKNDPANPKYWIVDEEAAAIVERIFRMTLNGKGTAQIAATLEDEGVLTPMNYWKSKGINRGGNRNGKPSRWNSSTVIKILDMQEYCGDVVNFKTYTKSFKNKKQLKNDAENRMVFKNVHQPIIDRAAFEKIQQQRGKVRKRKTSNGEKNMFSGLVVCADCGRNLGYHFNQGNHDTKYFNCQNYNRHNRTCPTSHYIRVDFLEEIVLREVKRLTKFASKYENVFIKAIMGFSQDAAAFEQRRKQKELNAMTSRDKDLDMLFEKLYEDNVAGKITDDRFAKMSHKYELEQKELAVAMEKLSKELAKNHSKADTVDSFIRTVRKYTRARKLTQRMLYELIERVEVHQAEKIDGKQVQRLVIHYHCVGAIDIPDMIPKTEIVMNTRKGVNVSYESSKRAI